LYSVFGVIQTVTEEESGNLEFKESLLLLSQDSNGLLAE
jgi:hypothetical protein